MCREQSVPKNFWEHTFVADGLQERLFSARLQLRLGRAALSARANLRRHALNVSLMNFALHALDQRLVRERTVRAVFVCAAQPSRHAHRLHERTS